jgi:hypothetical protein
MKVAAAQISCSLGDPNANLLKVRDFSREARDTGVELIVFPEMTDTGYSMPVIDVHANSWTSGFVPGLQEIAAKLSIAIVCGVSERDGTSIYNSLVFVDQRAKSLPNIERPTCMQWPPLKNRSVLLQATLSQALPLATCALASVFATISGFRRCIGNWPSNRIQVCLSFLPHGRFRALSISVRLCSRVRSKIRAM